MLERTRNEAVTLHLVYPRVKQKHDHRDSVTFPERKTAKQHFLIGHRTSLPSPFAHFRSSCLAASFRTCVAISVCVCVCLRACVRACVRARV